MSDIKKIFLLDKEVRDNLYMSIKYGKQTDVNRMLAQMRQKLSGLQLSAGDYQIYGIRLLNEFLMWGKYQNIKPEDIFNGESDYPAMLQRCESQEAFFLWIEECCLRIRSQLEKGKLNKTKKAIQNARKYIKEHYMESDFNLEKAARKVGLTPAYFSSVFKEECEENFVDFLTRLRMEDAYLQLASTGEKICVIAERVGYMDSGYFSQVFKKRYGVSPAECRKERIKKQNTKAELFMKQ